MPIGRVKYLLLPGYVTSKNDGDVHYISWQQLILLYRVDPIECTTLDILENRANLIHLMPRYDGDYTIRT